jgi:hypothetical protein
MRLRRGIAPLVVCLALSAIVALAVASLAAFLDTMECIANADRAYFQDENGIYELYRYECEGNTWTWVGGYWGELDPPPTPDLRSNGAWMWTNVGVPSGSVP